MGNGVTREIHLDGGDVEHLLVVHEPGADPLHVLPVQDHGVLQQRHEDEHDAVQEPYLKKSQTFAFSHRNLFS